ncbi:hypothetical protein [Saccharicrinis fermentans]|uniref:Uncharacterized protein n=1 Tax=Saccharicrinis fermentans DSM 9555 = JCM 21142 TaxID=869213 RepID=W7XXR2_9BACT|nr:hypothetical protein [Saccharicrinis fermentans]GAF03265.1 hypothetical protein JCM21142_41932 [Saccharicrinis fermentans DSM 9555 = JCM 21142]
MIRKAQNLGVEVKKEFGGEYQVFDCSSFVIQKYRYKLVWRLRKLENHSLAKWVYKMLKKKEYN